MDYLTNPLLAFLGISALVIATPGPDTAIIVSNGALTNTATGTITSIYGAGQGSRTITAALDNQAGGSIAVNYPLNLSGASSLDFGLGGPEGNQSVDFEVPLGALVGSTGVIPPGVLDDLTQAGVSLLQPVTDGGSLVVKGGVLDEGQLSSLTLNGQDVLSQLTTDHTFTVTIPGTTKTITLQAIDKQGNSETIHEQESVSATNALGVRIVKIRYLKGNVSRHHRLKMVITVKDRRGLLIRGARISVSSTKRGRLARRPHATLTGTRGKVTLGLQLRKVALGKKLVVLVVAKTPHAKARKRSSVRLPR